MILVSDIVSKITSAIDSEDSDRYLFQQDFLPAINYAIEYSVSVFNSIFAKDKLSEEVLKEIMRVRCFQATHYSRVAMDETIIGDKLWSIVSVMPKCTYVGTGVSGSIVTETIYLPNVSFLSSNYYAKRLTREQWGEKNKNPFMAGNPYTICSDLIEYAWTNFADYTGGYTLTNSQFEIEISPAVANQVVAISYLKKPTTIAAITDTLDFPEIMNNFIVSSALKFLSFKQNDNSTLYSVSDRDEQTLTKLFS